MGIGCKTEKLERCIRGKIIVHKSYIINPSNLKLERFMMYDLKFMIGGNKPNFSVLPINRLI